MAFVVVLHVPVRRLSDDHLVRRGRALERTVVALGLGLAVLARPSRMARDDGLVVDPVGPPHLAVAATAAGRARVLGQVLHAVAAARAVRRPARDVRIEGDVHHAGLGPSQEGLQGRDARDDDAEGAVALRADLVRDAAQALVARPNQLAQEDESTYGGRDDAAGVRQATASFGG